MSFTEHHKSRGMFQTITAHKDFFFMMITATAIGAAKLSRASYQEKVFGTFCNFYEPCNGFAIFWFLIH